MTAPAHRSACDRALARFREGLGQHWKPADDILFRSAWNASADVAHEKFDKNRRVLDALAAIPEATLRRWIARRFGAVIELAHAELARREGSDETQER